MNRTCFLFSNTVAFAAALSLAFAPVLSAGEFVLHPNGFGEHSYASWKAQQGLPDLNGNKNQALYLQKRTATPTFAAGVAVIQGYEGLPANELTGLEFWYRTDGHCGAGAPRFNVRVKPPAGPSQTIFVGCAGMLNGATLPGPNGTTYQQKIFTGPIAPVGTVTSLAIVFDEGDDVGPGFVFLDNITVQTTSATYPTKTWRSASDNSNQ